VINEAWVGIHKINYYILTNIILIGCRNNTKHTLKVLIFFAIGYPDCNDDSEVFTCRVSTGKTLKNDFFVT